MPETGNLYEIMGLARYASIGEVRAAFRRLAVLYHPDKNPGDAAAEERFKTISAAYDILGDETRKRNYDLKLTGIYTYVKTESPEEKLRQRKEQGQRRRQQKQKIEEAEIKQAYTEAQKKIPYKWRNTIAAGAMSISLLLIISNWFKFAMINGREWSFFLMFIGYFLSLLTVLFFLRSLFKKWNAMAIDRPFKFDIRNRITTYFIAYVLFMFGFSFTVPGVYKQAQLAAFGKTTQAVVATGPYPNLVLVYSVGDKQYVKSLELRRPYVGFTVNVTIRYSALQPFISEIVGVAENKEL
jgi:cation transport ATPase